LDLRQLEILQAIAETGSFTACGRKLHVSQSAISRQIIDAWGGAISVASEMGRGTTVHIELRPAPNDSTR